MAYLESLVSLGLPWQARQREIQVVGDITLLDAEHDNVLMLGPPMVDVACAKAKRAGRGIVLAQSIGTLPFAMVLDELSVRRGFSTLIVMTAPGLLRPVIERLSDIDSSVEGLYAEDEVIRGVVCNSNNASSKGTQSERESLSMEMIRSWLAAPKQAFELRSLTRWPKLTERGDLLVVCHRQRSLVRPGGSTDWEESRGFEWVMVDGPSGGSATWWERQAITEGVRVNESLWSRLEEQVFRGLAPKTSRSRLDAGATSGSLP